MEERVDAEKESGACSKRLVIAWVCLSGAARSIKTLTVSYSLPTNLAAILMDCKE